MFVIKEIFFSSLEMATIKLHGRLSCVVCWEFMSILMIFLFL